MPNMSAAQKREIQARVRAFNTSALISVPSSMAASATTISPLLDVTSKDGCRWPFSLLVYISVMGKRKYFLLYLR